MILHFNVTGERRKELVKAIENSLGVKAKYLGIGCVSAYRRLLR